jgi:23S rRNA (cytosine1962-C5)-methyltransferase
VTTTKTAKLILKKFEERRLLQGHLWVFSNEVERLRGEADNGDIIEVYDSANQMVGHALYNKNSLIAGRMLGKHYNGDFYEYIFRSLTDAMALREEMYPRRKSFRLSFSESDFLPGLIIDKYNDTYVLQVYSYGMQKNIDTIVEVLKTEFEAENIFTLNDTYFRVLEGLEVKDEVYLGSIGEEVIDDGSIRYKVKFDTAQKTGFYFDQCDNREFIEKLVPAKSVLDAFCNSGGFGLHAAYAGASEVTFVDISQTEVDNAKYNFELNGFSTPAEYFRFDVFGFLRRCKKEGKKFDVVVIDPPAFTKSKKTVDVAIKGYTKINKLAMMIIKDNGYLVTSSCSHHIKRSDFADALKLSAMKARRTVQLIHQNGAAMDHPQLPAMDETTYLKFAVFRIVGGASQQVDEDDTDD